MTEKDILEKIRQDSEQVTPPASLQPDAIEKLLTYQKINGAAPGQDGPVSPDSETRRTAGEPAHVQEAAPKKPRSKIYRMAARYGSLAAVFALALTAAWHANKASIRSKQEDSAAEAVADLSSAEKITEAHLVPDTADTVTDATDKGADAGEGAVEEAAEAPAEISANADQNATSDKAENQAQIQADTTEAAAQTSADVDGGAVQENAEAPADADEDAVQENAEISADADEAAVQDTTEAPSQEILTYAGSYEEIFKVLHDNFYWDADGGYVTDEIYYAEAEMADAGAGVNVSGSARSESKSAQMYDTAMNEDASYTSEAAGSAGSENGAKDFSDTNVQEKGVDEADIVKTDGSYIYILRSDCSVVIIEADGADSHIVSTLQIADDVETAANTDNQGIVSDTIAADTDSQDIAAADSGSQDTAADTTAADSLTLNPAGTSCERYIQEMYLDGDLLNVIVTEYVTGLRNEGDVYYNDTTEQTTVYTYDITDRSRPKLAGVLSQDGSYTNSRKVGSFLYLFTTHYPEIQDTYEDSAIVPRIGGRLAAASDFYIPERLSDRSYLVISSMNTAAPSQVCDSKVLVSGASLFYVSTENIYIAGTDYSSDTRTSITKFHFADGQITGIAAGAVRGYLNDSFSMNEYRGKLRVVTTYYGNASKPLRDSISRVTGLDLSLSDDWEERNGLYILDESLQQIGSVDDLAKGETVRSARFLGDTGYFVTFRQTDPLFSVDLSDPENPQILGELKISGFSSYLHFYGEDQMLGIGYEADESTGITNGLKLSMFDLSDTSDVSESSRFVIPGITWCPAINHYKAILVDPDRNIIGFYCDNRYLVFSYDRENGFTQELVYDFYADQLTGQAEFNTMRGLFIGDTLYLAGETFLVTFDMNNGFEKTGVLNLTAEGAK